jgi:hypothetical protein
MGWDVMQVVYQTEDPSTGEKRIGNSFVIARTQEGFVLRKVDLVLDQWERITDEEDLRYFLSCFNNRDKLLAEEAAKKAAGA